MKKIDLEKEVNKMIKEFSKNLDNKVKKFITLPEVTKTKTPFMDDVFFLIHIEKQKEEERRMLNGYKIF